MNTLWLIPSLSLSIALARGVHPAKYRMPYRSNELPLLPAEELPWEQRTTIAYNNYGGSIEALEIEEGEIETETPSFNENPKQDVYKSPSTYKGHNQSIKCDTISGKCIAAPHFPIPIPSISLRTGTRPFTVAVEGNVGAGKSTLLNYFLKYPDITVHKEPLHLWQNLNGTNFLQLVYQDQARWGMTFESLVSLTMLETHLKDRRTPGVRFKPVKVMERSLHSARQCFVEQLSDVMKKAETVVLDSWYNLLVSRPELDTSVDLVVYLRTSPETAYARVQSRSRSEEMTIPFSYFQRLHDLHEDWLIKRNPEKQAMFPLPQVIVLDANEDLSSLALKYKQLAKDVWRTVNIGYNNF